MAGLKEKVEKAVAQFEVSQKAKAAVKRSTDYNTAVSEIAKRQRELKNQGS